MEVQCGAAGGEAGVKKPVGPAQVVCARLVFLEHSRDLVLTRRGTFIFVALSFTIFVQRQAIGKCYISYKAVLLL